MRKVFQKVFKAVQKMGDQLPAGDERDITKWIKGSRVIDSVSKIPGDASTRKYFRLFSGEQTFILMKRDPFKDKGERLPFLAIQKYLYSLGIAVPEVFEYDPSLGFILLEDLGDTTLLHRMETVADEKVERTLYEKAIDTLVDLQVKATPPSKTKSLEAFTLYFDLKKMMWEVNFTIEHFYEIHLKRRIRQSDRKILHEGFEKICANLAEQPRVFAHRDYHSRNLMVVGNRIVLIDFQDARMGPAQYDLVSLLKDSYYQLEGRQVETLIDYYIQRFQEESGKTLDREEFLRVFDLMSIQRNFKAIGSFASFLNRRSNATYLKYIGNTFESMRRVLLRHPEFSSLREVLFHYYYF